LAQWVRESSDYVYLGKGKNYRTPADFVLAYEKPDGLQDGINVVFVDGRVYFVKMDHAMKLIKAGRGSPE
jgi:prepilin-type processing-associated H-X9-DG protein